MLFSHFRFSSLDDSGIRSHHHLVLFASHHVSLVFLEKSALKMACDSGRDTMAKVRWLIDRGASVCKLLEYTDFLGDWRLGVAAPANGPHPDQVVAALERLFRKHCAMVVRLIGLKTDVPLLPLALEQEVASFLV